MTVPVLGHSAGVTVPMLGDSGSAGWMWQGAVTVAVLGDSGRVQ